jgi:hypothetical protein
MEIPYDKAFVFTDFHDTWAGVALCWGVSVLWRLLFKRAHCRENSIIQCDAETKVRVKLQEMVRDARLVPSDSSAFSTPFTALTCERGWEIKTVPFFFFFLTPSSLQFAAKIMWCLDQNWLVPGHFRCSCVGISVVLRHWFSYCMAREGIFIYEMKWLLVPGSFIVQSTTVKWSCSNILRDMETCALISVLPNVSCQGRIFAIG